jgi:RsiW-degrading membrane proteinase PrsW (M82 family)
MTLPALIFSVIPFSIVISLGYKNYTIALICGVLAGFIALPVETLLQFTLNYVSGYTSIFVSAFVCAAIPEEILKFSILMFTKLKIKNPREIVILLILTGLGFGTIENILYIIHHDAKNTDLPVIFLMILRVLLPLSMHMLCGAIAATGILFKNLNKSMGVTLAIIFHGLYNAVIIRQLDLISNRLVIAMLFFGIVILAVILRLASNAQYKNSTT